MDGFVPTAGFFEIFCWRKMWNKRFRACEIFRSRGKWNEINPLTPAGISHGEAIFHTRSVFLKSRKGFISLKKARFRVYFSDWGRRIRSSSDEPRRLRQSTGLSPRAAFRIRPPNTHTSKKHHPLWMVLFAGSIELNGYFPVGVQGRSRRKVVESQRFSDLSCWRKGGFCVWTK